MADSESTRLDVLDFVISVLSEHEKEIDRIVKELTRLITIMEEITTRFQKGAGPILMVDENLYRKALELGVDVSDICEKALREEVSPGGRHFSRENPKQNR